MACASDHNCGKNNDKNIFCVEGTCTGGGSVVGTRCNNKLALCDAPLFCAFGRCRAVDPAGSMTYKNQKFSIPQACTSDLDCADGQMYCKAGDCVFKAPKNGDCPANMNGKNGPCQDGLVCFEEKCQPACYPKEIRCMKDSMCYNIPGSKLGVCGVRPVAAILPTWALIVLCFGMFALIIAGLAIVFRIYANDKKGDAEDGQKKDPRKRELHIKHHGTDEIQYGYSPTVSVPASPLSHSGDEQEE